MTLEERVARAVCCARSPCEGCNGLGEGGCFEMTLWDAEARAAIAAVMEWGIELEHQVAELAIEGFEKIAGIDPVTKKPSDYVFKAESGPLAEAYIGHINRLVAELDANIPPLETAIK